MIDEAYIYTLVAHWDSQRNTFHFPIIEMMIMIEKMYRIYRLPIEGRMLKFAS